MRELILTTRFRRDLRRAASRGKDERRLREVLATLVAGEPLEPRHRAHQLTGNMSPLWECHIENDWLLVWDENETTVTLMQTGTHSDIFG
jgi:mRNA interferase YafQ